MRTTINPIFAFLILTLSYLHISAAEYPIIQVNNDTLSQGEFKAKYAQIDSQYQEHVKKLLFRYGGNQAGGNVVAKIWINTKGNVESVKFTSYVLPKKNHLWRLERSIRYWRFAKPSNTGDRIVIEDNIYFDHKSPEVKASKVMKTVSTAISLSFLVLSFSITIAGLSHR